MSACLAFNFSASAIKSVNPILKDNSYIYFMGEAPDENASNELRIACHLLYAEYVLRRQNTAHLDAKTRLKRERILDLLHEYALNGTYPKNYDYPGERKPCFIDQDGTICAVGYLVEQTEGRETAESINEQYKYAEIYEMDLDLIAEWAKDNGLTVKECAMIQPTYGFHDTRRTSIEVSPLVNYRGQSIIAFGAQLMYMAHHFPFGYKFKGIGLEVQRLGAGDFSTALRLQYGNSWTRWFAPYVALNSEVYWIDKRSGFNLKPELGVDSKYSLGKMYAHANLSYGYHFGLVNHGNYTVGRNDLGIAIGIGIDL